MPNDNVPTTYAAPQQVRREKVEIENALEQEQEFIVNRLQAELTKRQRQSEGLQAQIEKVWVCVWVCPVCVWVCVGVGGWVGCVCRERERLKTR